MSSEAVVIGGGLVGSAIAYGLVKAGLRVLLLDGEDRDFRAANANGGLVWLHTKGLGLPAYQALTRTSLDLWPSFCSDLEALGSLDLQYEHNGGVALCLSDDELDRRSELLMQLDVERGHNSSGGFDRDWEILGRSEVQKLFPKVRLGPEVVGASIGHRDGHCNPLTLLTALQTGILNGGGEIRGGARVHAIRGDHRGGFLVDFGSESVEGDRVVIAAGLASKALAAQVGIDLPIRPERGQVLITERVEPILPYPLFAVSQTQQGTISIGVTNEDVGLDTTTTFEAAAGMSAQFLRWFPALSDVKLVRQWSGLRILTPDGYSIYTESETNPGAFAAVCHSGVTLAAAHAGPLAQSIAKGKLSGFFDPFHQRRFDVSQAG